MLSFERQVVATLASGLDDTGRAKVEGFVEQALAVMPAHLRAGVVAETVLLGPWSKVRAAAGGDGAPLDRQLETWASSPIGPLRQYVRLLRSLVLFAEQELVAA